MLDIQIEEENLEKSLLALNVKGELDSSSFLDFYDYVLDKFDKGYSLVILDFSNLASLSSAGISVLLRIKNKFDEKNSFLILYNLKQEIYDLFQFLGLHKVFLLASTTKELSKVLDSLDILRKTESEEHVVSNRFGLLLEENEVPQEKKQENLEKKDAHLFFDEAQFITQEEKLHSKTTGFTTTPEFEEIPFVEEIETEPFLESKQEDFDFTIPFFSKSDEDTKQVPESILESAFSSPNEEFREVKVNCGKCGIQMRILSQGIHRCPNCKARFAFRQSGSISTIEKLS